MATGSIQRAVFLRATLRDMRAAGLVASIAVAAVPQALVQEHAAGANRR